ncbi:MAG: ribonuclease III [Deltaproteobacteria bacterium]|jgi:UDP-N-acetylmuramate: L-alanyl-gamma-D-glutamyl-meso-diaminopimelate ligase|nr:ribonuclease III [Deltaproteobacteria bacterium]
MSLTHRARKILALPELAPELNVAPYGQLKGLKIHLLGVGGVAMASLAGLLLAEGALVSGTDTDVFPPVSLMLKRLGLEVRRGYDGASLYDDPDLVVIGNIISRSMPVVSVLRDRQIPYLSLPQTLSHYFLSRTLNLVVAGCHGKTTITNMCAALFEAGGLKPGYLVGGDSLDLAEPFKAAHNGGWFIVEGDEYDSAFFNKVPKFVHYRPHTVILTSVDYDHADIYPNRQSMIDAYLELMRLIPPHGLLIARGDDPQVREVASQAQCRKLFYGPEGHDSELELEVGFYRPEGLSGSFYLKNPFGPPLALSLPRPGLYNAVNAAAAVGAFLAAMGDSRAVASGLVNHGGVRLRQQVVGVYPTKESESKAILIDDYAHHPTAVARTLEAIRAAYPNSRILAAFEPRSNTSRRAVFQELYSGAFAVADWVFLSPVVNPTKAPAGDRLNLAKLKKDIVKATLAKSIDDLAQRLLKTAEPGDVIVLMSNGDFGGLAKKMALGLAKKFPGPKPVAPDYQKDPGVLGYYETAEDDKDVNSRESSEQLTGQPTDRGFSEAPAQDLSPPVDQAFLAVSNEDEIFGQRLQPPAQDSCPYPIEVLADRLGFEMRDPSLFLAAVTHRSMVGGSNRQVSNCETSNQRLEFLGDAVIDLCIAEFLFPVMPRLNEGQMTRLRAWMVCEARLAEVAASIHLGQYIIMTSSERACGGASKSSVLADAMEAFIAAFFIDQGIEATRLLITKLWSPYLEYNFLMRGPTDPKTDLQEASQGLKIGLPTYVTKITGPPHSPIFHSEVKLLGQIASGQGMSKKEAEQEAAGALLELLNQLHPWFAQRICPRSDGEDWPMEPKNDGESDQGPKSDSEITKTRVPKSKRGL